MAEKKQKTYNDLKTLHADIKAGKVTEPVLIDSTVHVDVDGRAVLNLPIDQALREALKLLDIKTS